MAKRKVYHFYDLSEDSQKNVLLNTAEMMTDNPKFFGIEKEYKEAESRFDWLGIQEYIVENAKEAVIKIADENCLYYADGGLVCE